jgi:heterodisulfide reductase subunit A
VIGGGIAGIQASLDIANCGHKVIFIEKGPSIGGHMSQLSETFPTLDCSQCILTPRMVEVAQNPNITLYTYAELEKLEGFVGNFKATIRLKAKSVDYSQVYRLWTLYHEMPDRRRFQVSLMKDWARVLPSSLHSLRLCLTSLPSTRSIVTTIRKVSAKCVRSSVPTGAIEYDKPDEFMTEQVGAVVVTTGFNVLKTDFFPEYGYGKYKDVITGLQFERLASASGPTLGEIRRPSDGADS